MGGECCEVDKVPSKFTRNLVRVQSQDLPYYFTTFINQVRITESAEIKTIQRLISISDRDFILYPNFLSF